MLPDRTPEQMPWPVQCPNSPVICRALGCDICLLCRTTPEALSAEQETVQAMLSKESPSLTSGVQRAGPAPPAASSCLTAARQARQQPPGASRACTGAAPAAVRPTGCLWAGEGAAGKTLPIPGQCPPSTAGLPPQTSSCRTSPPQRASLPLLWQHCRCGATGGLPAQRHATSQRHGTERRAWLSLAALPATLNRRRAMRLWAPHSPPYRSMCRQRTPAALAAASLSRSMRLLQAPSGP